MRTHQGNLLESLRNVKTFLDLHADLLQDVVKTGSRDALLQAIADLEGYSNQQAAGTGSARNATKHLTELRKQLIGEHMALIARIARAKLPRTPELANLRMPRGKQSDTKLATAAYEMANAATPFATVFVDAGVPADFPAQLKAAADALIGAREERSMSRVSRVTATKGLHTKLSAGRKVVHVLDVMVRRALKFEPELLAGWNQVKRVSKVTGLPAHGPAPVPTPVPVPTPTPVPTPVPHAA